MRVALLDINVLLALAWPNHRHHADATAWFAREAGHGWATCVLTQLGFVRLSSNPAFTPAAVSPREAARLLSLLTAHPAHRYWPTLPAANSATIFAACADHRQVTDAFLVALAAREGARLVTFDRGAPVHARVLDEVFLLQKLP